jgi:hypothetical protein
VALQLCASQNATHKPYNPGACPINPSQTDSLAGVSSLDGCAIDTTLNNVTATSASRVNIGLVFIELLPIYRKLGKVIAAQHQSYRAATFDFVMNVTKEMPTSSTVPVSRYEPVPENSRGDCSTSGPAG